MTATFYVGDVLEVLAKLPDDSVDLVLSSPPFLALRSYLPQDHPDKGKEGGSQSTPGEYLDWLLDVVEACERVLAPHGSLCFELGDTYSGSGGAGGDYNEQGIRAGQSRWDGSVRLGHGVYIEGKGRLQNGNGWPLSKSLSLIPESFRWAMVYGHNPHTGRQTDRWRLRNVIRWVRPNPPVGALGDKFRPATSELMVFCKSATRFFDLDAVREPYSERFERGMANGERRGSLVGAPDEYAMKNFPKGMSTDHAAVPPLDWWNIPPGGYPGAHYAVWPPELLIRPIKAMTPDRVCRTCGEPSRRIVGKSERYQEARRLLSVRAGSDWDNNSGNRADGLPSAAARAKLSDGSEFTGAEYTTLGFSDCSHDNWRPGLVLDPFAGSGTTLSVASGHGRDSIGIDIDERNYRLALDRVGPLVLEQGVL
jgi:hypothetical protein